MIKKAKRLDKEDVIWSNRYMVEKQERPKIKVKKK